VSKYGLPARIDYEDDDEDEDEGGMAIWLEHFNCFILQTFVIV
jgi:hypothetical protein